YLLIAALVRRSPYQGVIPLLALMGVFLFYGKSLLGGLTRQSTGIPPAFLLVAVLIVFVLTVWWLARRPFLLDRVNTFLALTGLLMVGWLSARFLANQFRSRSIIEGSALAAQLARPINSRAAAGGQVQPVPDIYLLVLDEYAHAAVLQNLFQFENRMFEDSLRQLGFTIPRLVRSNYVHTVLSLPSLLNFSHLTRLTQEVGARSTDASLPNYLLEHNRTASYLKQRGYRFLFYPSQWWPSTNRNRNADWEFDAWTGFNPAREVSRSDLRRSLIRTTALDYVIRDDAWDADFIRRTLTALEAVPEHAEPTFAFAHIVSPHWPYVFQADCRVARETQVSGRVGRQRAYIDQLQCLIRLILHTVSTILQRSTVPPVILLQGDHGTNLLRYSDAASAKAVTSAQASERLGAFGAYYLPGAGRALFADSVTVVNVLQKVLSYYAGADVSPQPDDLYVSLERTPYDFAPVAPSELLY
ncbi:MAG TPA: sulfatase-like hydrolase/transferase, partial [Gemmatimonadales bacterium]